MWPFMWWLNNLVNRFGTRRVSADEQAVERRNNWENCFRFFGELRAMLLRVSKRYALSKRYQYSGHFKSNESKVVVVTGGEKGIGRETALNLARHGYKVYIGVKDLPKAEEMIEKAQQENVAYELIAVKLDLASIESVRTFAKAVEKEEKIDLLINNSSDFEQKRVVTLDLLEKNFVQNYLGHYLLTSLLLNNLKKSDNGRVVNVTSIAYHFGQINFEDINSSKQYRPFTAYAQSKLAQVLFTRELAKRLKDSNVTVYSVSPEALRSENFKYPENQRNILTYLMDRLTDPEAGAQTILYVALEDKLRNESGYHYYDLQRVDVMPEQAIDDSIAEKLWDLSEDLIQSGTKPKVPYEKMLPE